MHVFWVTVFVASVALAGCLAGDGSDPDAGTTTSATPQPPAPEETEIGPVPPRLLGGPPGPNESAPEIPQWSFTTPVLLTTDGFGYEPSIAVGPDGAVYVTAARSHWASPPGQLSSWLWSSADGNQWEVVRSPADIHNLFPAFEGDITVGPDGTLYFVDTSLADNSLSIWDSSENGPVWRHSRPIQGTTGTDDRPWIVASGDRLYYLANQNPASPGPEGVQEGDVWVSNAWIYQSQDQGLTWSLGRSLRPATLCNLAADHEGTAWVGCYGGGQIIVNNNLDGQWTREAFSAVDHGNLYRYPGIGVDGQGIPRVAWFHKAGDQMRVMTAVRLLGEWHVQDVTPFNGTFQMAWVAGGPDGQAAITFYGTTAASGSAGDWYGYALLTADQAIANASWMLVPLDETPIRQDSVESNPDFFQSAFGPDGTLHVAYGRFVGNTGTFPLDRITDDIYVVRTTTPLISGPPN